MTRAVMTAAVVLSGCSLAAADHERLGDKAYREGRYGDAVAEYRAAEKGGGRPRLWAKLGAAALGDRSLQVAVGAYTNLATDDPSRQAEAAAGLERAAHAARRSGAAGATVLAAAVRALRTVAPGRPLGRFALIPMPGLPAAELVGALPPALASAPDARTVDSLLLAYGDAQLVTTDCESATRTLGTVLRRTRDESLRTRAGEGMSRCALRLGLDAMDADQPESAESWFDKAVRGATATPVGWRAAIGLGDARLRQGDVIGAAIAWQGVLSATGVPDSLVKLATDKLNALGGASPPPPEGTGE